MSALATSHNDRCVCQECMRRKFPRTVPELLAEERAKPQANALSQVQRRHLAGIVKNWNALRQLRGEPLMLADDALTQVLRTFEQLTSDELKFKKEVDK
jgi:hypothetical protein